MRARSLAALLASTALIAAACAPLPLGPDSRVRGPIAARNQHPLALTVLALPPRRAATLARGRTGVELMSVYTSIYESGLGPGERVVFDGEVLRSSATVRQGVGPNTDVELQLAAVYTSSGFLDGFADAFHDTLQFADGGRSRAADDQHDMRLVRNGRTIYEVHEDEVALADVPVIVTHRVLAEDDGTPGVALRAGVELPTGSESAGAGNGGLDWGAGVVIEKNWPRWSITGGVDLVIPSTPDSFAGSGVDLSNVLQLQNGYEYRWTDRFSLLAQLFWTSPMIDDFSLEEISRDVLDVGLGFAVDTSRRSKFTMSFHEDLVAATGPDFSALLAWTWGY